MAILNNSHAECSLIFPRNGENELYVIGLALTLRYVANSMFEPFMLDELKRFQTLISDTLGLS